MGLWVCGTLKILWMEKGEHGLVYKKSKSHLEDSNESYLSRTSKHSGPLKALQFNPFRSELLATAGANGEV